MKRIFNRHLGQCFILLLLCSFFILMNNNIVKASSERTVVVAISEFNGFYERDENNEPYGYGVEYLAKISEITNWKYEYIWASSWAECVELVESGVADMFAPATQTNERIGKFAFSTFSMGLESGSLLTLDSNNDLIYEDFEGFNNIRVGCEKQSIFNSTFIEYAKENNFNVEIIYYDNLSAIKKALNQGEIDAFVSNIFNQTTEYKLLERFVTNPVYYMLSLENTALLDELNNAMQQINLDFPNFQTELRKKYYPSFSNLPFSKDELEYIASAPTLMIGYRSNMKPVSYQEAASGEFKGMTRDILDLISEITQLKFDYVALPEGSVDYDFLRDNKISLISSVEYNSINAVAPGLKLTIPYMNSQKIFVTNPELLFDINAYHKVAVASGSSTLAEVIESVYPNFDVVMLDRVVDCFEALRNKDVDAILLNQYVVTDFLAKPIYSHLLTVPVEGLDDKLCLSPVVYQEQGVSDTLLDDERLITILNKAIRQIEDNEVNKIIIKHTNENQYNYQLTDFLYQYRYFLGFILFILLILGFIIAYAMKVRAENYKIVKVNEEKLRNITNNINGGVVVLLDHEGLKITYANVGFLDLLQYDRIEYEKNLDKQYITYVHPDDVPLIEDIISRDFEEDIQISFKLRIMRKDGNYIPTLFNGTLTRNDDNEKEIYCVIMDITEQERLIEKLSFEQEKYGLIVENAGSIIFEIDANNLDITISPNFEDKFGFKVGERLANLDTANIIQQFRLNPDDQPVLSESLVQVIKQKSSTNCIVRIRDSYNEYLWCNVYVYPMFNKKGELVCVIGRIDDINAEYISRQELVQKSQVDHLTGLLNKAAFFEQAADYLSDLTVTNFALIFIDIDNFKEVNDILGHMMGDSAIKDIAGKLQLVFANLDLIGRFGGDEFCVLVKNIAKETLVDKLEWANTKLKSTYNDGTHEVECSASIGAVYCVSNVLPFEALVIEADKALYKVKKQGKDSFVIIDII